MSEHILVVSRDEDYVKLLAQHREPDEQDVRDAYQVHIECPTPEHCTGWEECRGPHTSPDGLLDANDGPYDCEEDVPWEGQEEFEFHGELHTWCGSWGWMVPFPGCIVVAQGIEVPGDIDTERDGRWLIEDDWDDTDCYLVLVRELTGDDDE